MKLSKSQSGFTAVHMLLVLVLLGIIGFTGWKVYNASKSPKLIESSPIAASAATKKEVSKIPDGFATYVNKELGFKFAYPKEWGEISTEKLSGYKSQKHFYLGQADEGTKEIILTFSINKEVIGSLRSPSYIAAPKDSGSAIISYCKQNQDYVPSYPKTVPGEKFDLNGQPYGNDLVANGQEDCTPDEKFNDVTPIGANAIVIPKVCNDDHGCPQESIFESFLIIKTGNTTYPGLKFINYGQKYFDEYKKIAPTYQKL